MAHLRVIGALLAATAVFCSMLVAGPTAAAADDPPSFEVNIADDKPLTPCDGVKDHECSLRTAIANSLGKVRKITFRADVTKPITLNRELQVDGSEAPGTDITIDGAGKTIIDGGCKTRILEVWSAKLTLNQLTLQNGNGMFDNESSGGGGAVLAHGGTDVTLANSAVKDNHVVGDGGAINVQTEGINQTALTIQRTTISGNHVNSKTQSRVGIEADSPCRAVMDNSGGTGGGIHFNSGPGSVGVTVRARDDVGNTPNPVLPSLDISDSSVKDNSVDGKPASADRTDGMGGGIALTGAILKATISGSTISSNRVDPALHNSGGGIHNAASDSTVTVTNSTINGNVASGRASAGGIVNTANGAVTVTNSTVTDNSVRDGAVTESPVPSGQPPAGSGIFVSDSGSLTLQNAIVANSPVNCRGSISSLGHNLAPDESCRLTLDGDKPNTEPKLGPLRNNGGPTETRALLTGSEARNSANQSACPPTDQRGRPRVSASDPNCDMGAYEAQQPTIAIRPTCSPLGATNKTYPITVTGDGFVPETAKVTFNGGDAVETPVDGSGHFSAEISPSKQRSGVYEVLAVDTQEGRASTHFQEPCPTTPVITINPVCAVASGANNARAYSFSVHGIQFVPGLVRITFAGKPAGTATADSNGEFTVTIEPPRQSAGEYVVRAEDARDQSAVATFRDPCPQLTVTPSCGVSGSGPDTYQLVVEGTAFTKGSAVHMTFGAGSASQETLPDVTSDSSGHFKTNIAPALRARGTYQVQATDGKLPPAAADFLVPCVEPDPGPTVTPSSPPPVATATPTSPPPATESTPSATPTDSPPPTPSVTPTEPAPGVGSGPPGAAPSLQLVSSVGPAGFATTAIGTGFPANSKVRLVWDRGLTETTLNGVQTDSTGSFTVTVLVYSHDPLGPRKLKATPAQGAQPFKALDAGYLVVPGSGQPPTVSGGSGQRDDSLVFRH